MTVLLLVWFAASSLSIAQPADLSLDVRVFKGVQEVTRETAVSIFDTGSRQNSRRIPLGTSGERQIMLSPGQYDLQLVQHDEGRVLGVRWTSLRLLVAYPNEHGRHLEVLNLQPGYGALQIRQAGALETGHVNWDATLRPAGGGEAVSPVQQGDGYLLFVGRPGTYDVEVRTASGTRWIRNAEIHAEQTFLATW
jgi:hypothetical protein